jgi:hypothetical protein
MIAGLGGVLQGINNEIISASALRLSVPLILHEPESL